MADNIQLNTGTGGDIAAADDIAGAKYQRVKLIHGADGVNDGDVSNANPYPVKVQSLGTIDSGNSTTTPLAGSGTFTGTYVDLKDYASIVVSIFADQSSATDGVKFQWSSNGTNLDIEETSEFTINAGRGYYLSPRAQFFRVVFTNGGSAQTIFRLETILRTQDVGFFSRPIDKAIDDTFFAQLTRTVLAAKRNDGTYGNIRSTNGNNIKVSVSELDGISTQDAGRVFVKNPAGTNMGDATTPVRVDPTGTTTQPVSAASLPLPTGASTLGEQQTQTTALQLIDDTVHATNAALSKANAIAGQLDDAATTAATEDNVAPIRITAQRGAHVNLRNNAGTELGTAGAPVRTDPTGTTTQPVSGTVTANAGTGTFSTQIAAETTNRVEVHGDVAHDVAAAGNPVLCGLRANQNEPAAVADADSTYAWGDQQGRTVVAPHFPANAAGATHGPISVNATASGNTTVVSAPGASLSIYVVGFWLSNQGTAKIRAALTDGAAGASRYRGTLAADGGGVTRDLMVPWKLTANTALVVNLGAAGDVDVNVDFFVAP